MKYIKKINEEFKSEVSCDNPMNTLMDYDAFELNGSDTSAKEKEDETELDENEIEVRKSPKQVG